MRVISSCLCFFACALALTACLPRPPDVTTEDAIGIASRLQDQVQEGRAGQDLQALVDRADLFDNHQIAVSDGGEALLDLGNAMRINLFNNSESTVSLQAAEDTPSIVRFVLARGGLLGEKALDDERQVQIETPAGASITVLATVFFVTYDANTQVTTVGNFDGTVIAGSDAMMTEMAPATYVVWEAGKAPGPPQRLYMGADAFRQRARELSSPLAVVEEMLQGVEPGADETTAPAFAVTAAQAFITNMSSSTCPTAVTFSGIITVNDAGTVRYRWDRSDGAVSPAVSTTFTQAGSAPVRSSEWHLSASGTFWQRLHVLAPNELVSNQAGFTLNCPPRQPDLVVQLFYQPGSATVSATGSVELPVRAVVRNIGNAAADIFKVSAHYAVAGGKFVAPFTVRGQESIWYAYTSEPLEPGAAVVFEGIVTLPAALQGSVVSLTVVADSCSGDEFMPAYCRVEESNEDNNESATLLATLPCSLPSVTADATFRAVNGEADIEWQTVGGCTPFTGTLTGRWSHENIPFLTESLSQPSGFYTHRPVIPCGGGTIVYTVTLFDRDGQRTSDSVNVPVFYIC
jgi:hypothetical protein